MRRYSERWFQKGDLFFFHIILKYYRHAHQAFEEFVSYKKLKRVLVITHDPLLCSIIMEWDYTVERDACWFIDGGRLEKPNTKVKDAVFRLALLSDSAQIIEKSGDFFDKLQERIKDDTIFVLEENGEHLGYGIIERGRYFPSCVSIGMICDKKHRKKGVGQTILWNLKELVYSEGKKPVAGCWYYNILSRKTLERAGMLAVAKGFTAVLKEKEKPPLRTGNRPGELVEG